MAGRLFYLFSRFNCSFSLALERLRSRWVGRTGEHACSAGLPTCQAGGVGRSARGTREEK